jgi:hypothetical protein
VPFFAQELIAAMRSGKPRKTIQREATNVAMSAWLSGCKLAIHVDHYQFMHINIGSDESKYFC